VLNFIAITDDRATYYGRSGGGLGTQQTEAQPFIDTIQELLRADGFAKATPEAPLGFLFHSIVGYTYSDLDSRGHLQNRPELATTPTTCPDVTTYGAPYVELSIKTGGSLHQICQSDWSSIFAKVANVATNTALQPCRQTIVYPSDGSVPTQTIPLYVTYTSVAPVQQLFQATHSAGNVCPTGASAASPTFIVDSTTTPTKVTLCSAACGYRSQDGVLEFDWRGSGLPGCGNPQTSPTPSPILPPDRTGSPTPPDAPSPPSIPTPVPAGAETPTEGSHEVSICCDFWPPIWITLLVTIIVTVVVLLIVLLVAVCMFYWPRWTRNETNKETRNSKEKKKKI